MISENSNSAPLREGAPAEHSLSPCEGKTISTSPTTVGQAIQSEPTVRLTWRRLVAAEPRLANIEKAVKQRAKASQQRFVHCGNDETTGWVFPSLSAVVGWHRKEPKVVNGIDLSTTEAFNVAFGHLDRFVPNCRGCGCFGAPPARPASPPKGRHAIYRVFWQRNGQQTTRFLTDAEQVGDLVRSLRRDGTDRDYVAVDRIQGRWQAVEIGA